MNKAPDFVLQVEQRDAFHDSFFISRNDIHIKLDVSITVRCPGIGTPITLSTTTASYLPREERYSVKSITNDDRTTCCGMRLVPSRSWLYFGIRYSKLACLRSTCHIAS
ncbi:hypothetical protein ALC60_14714 [Trachymyrmex zeteki]|uniref:Uncharacterized protein n=1 Tax=Mycetomoellerius zeteki TaxID=64791 RepID=A0A151WEQ9_9HYME|nr:hypothetical protein ALC60_14714 [Trachymyrmex zeteki]